MAIGSLRTTPTLPVAAAGTIGELRFDPFAMLPFCGYNMGDYFKHWLEIGQATDSSKLPKLFWVNWFRKDEDGKFLWPGFGENSRVLEWIFRRCDDAADATETPIGLVPTVGALNTEGLDISEDELAELLKVDAEEWKAEIPQITEWFEKFGDDLPTVLWTELDGLKARLGV